MLEPTARAVVSDDGSTISLPRAPTQRSPMLGAPRMAGQGRGGDSAGTTLGGAIGSSLGESLFPEKAKPVDLGPGMTPLKDLPPLSTYVGGGSTRYPTARMPDKTYRPGIDSQFRYFPAG